DMSDDHYLDGVRGEFLVLLQRLKAQYGLTDTAITSLVRGAEFSHPPGGSQIEGTENGGFIRFLVQGFVKLACEQRLDDKKLRRLTIDLIGPGDFLCMPTVRPPLKGRVVFRVHEAPVTLALLPQHLVQEVQAGLPAENLCRFVLRMWQPARVTQKVIQLALPMPERLSDELRRLAGWYGIRQDEAWVGIRAVLVQSDLGEVIDRGRSNVNRVWRALRSEGKVRRVRGHLLVSAPWLEAAR